MMRYDRKTLVEAQKTANVCMHVASQMGGWNNSTRPVIGTIGATEYPKTAK